MFYYYFYLETIIEMEINIAKVSFTSKQVIELEHSMRVGLPYYTNGHESYGNGEDTSTTGAMCDLVSIVNSGKAIHDINQTEIGKRVIESQKQAG